VSLRGLVRAVKSFAKCLCSFAFLVICERATAAHTARPFDLVFTQTERVENIDGGKCKAAEQAKLCVDTGAVAFTVQGVSRAWAVGTGMLRRHGLASEDTVRDVLSASFLRRTIHGCKPSDRLPLRHSHRGPIRGTFKGEKRLVDRRTFRRILRVAPAFASRHLSISASSREQQHKMSVNRSSDLFRRSMACYASQPVGGVSMSHSSSHATASPWAGTFRL